MHLALRHRTSRLQSVPPSEKAPICSQAPAEGSPGAVAAQPAATLPDASQEAEKGAEDTAAGTVPRTDRICRWGISPHRTHPAGIRTVMARLASASSDKTDDAVEEADVPHGALTVPLLRHQRRALAWMTARESGTGPLGGMLADDQVPWPPCTAAHLLSCAAFIVSATPPPSHSPFPA